MLNMHTMVLGVMLVLCSVGCTATWAAGEGGAPSPANPPTPARDWTQLDADEEELDVWDPIEPFNRGMFWFNDKLYFYAVKPVARGYRVVLHEDLRQAVGNFFHNLATPVRFLNALLQLKGVKATDELVKFIFNSTFGLAGLLDVGAGLPAGQGGEDFGQTLGHYGMPPGFYLVIPVLGPSNARDAVGKVADALTHPVTSPYYFKMEPLEVVGAQALEKVNALSLDKDTYEAIKQDALDPYLFVRNAFMQNRAAKVEN